MYLFRKTLVIDSRQALTGRTFKNNFSLHFGFLKKSSIIASYSHKSGTSAGF